MLLVYNKTTGQIQAKFSENQSLEVLYKNNPRALDTLAELYVDQAPEGNISEYKVVAGSVVKMTEVEIEGLRLKNPTERKLEQLEQENILLYTAIAELSILIGGST